MLIKTVDYYANEFRFDYSRGSGVDHAEEEEEDGEFIDTYGEFTETYTTKQSTSKAFSMRHGGFTSPVNFTQDYDPDSTSVNWPVKISKAVYPT